MKKFLWRITCCTLLVAAATVAFAQTSVPQKAFAIEEGLIAVRGGVMPNPDAPAALPLGKLKYPSRYFVQVVNESPYPIWVDASWKFPDNKKDSAGAAKAVRSSKLPPNGSYWFFVNKLSVLVGQTIFVELGVYADEKRTSLVGNQTAELLFDQPDVNLFHANYPSAYKNQTPQSREAAVISGWKDVPVARTDVPGTAADAQLQKDIQGSIWKADSIGRWRCNREILSAEVLAGESSLILASRGPDEKEKARADMNENRLRTERWQVRSCGEDYIYEVLMVVAVHGGTDIEVADLAMLAND